MFSFKLAHVHTLRLPEKDMTSVIMTGGKALVFDRHMQIVNVQRQFVTLAGVMNVSYYCKQS